LELVHGKRKNKRRKERENLYLVQKMSRREMSGLHASNISGLKQFTIILLKNFAIFLSQLGDLLKISVS